MRRLKVIKETKPEKFVDRATSLYWVACALIKRVFLIILIKLGKKIQFSKWITELA